MEDEDDDVYRIRPSKRITPTNLTPEILEKKSKTKSDSTRFVKAKCGFICKLAELRMHWDICFEAKGGCFFPPPKE